MGKQKNPIDIAMLRQLRKAKAKPSLPTYSGTQTTNRLAKRWPKVTFFYPVSKKDAPVEHTPVTLFEQRALEQPRDMLGPPAKQRQMAHKTIFERLMPRVLPSFEAKKIKQEEEPDSDPETRPS